MSRVRVGVIGVGNIGRQHARIYASLPGAELVGVADRDAARAQAVAREHGCASYSTAEAFLSQEEPAAVSVAVPTAQHEAVTAEVIARGVSPLVEKPLAGTPEEAERIVELAARTGVRLGVGHLERFNPAVRRLRSLVAEGALGRVLSVSARRVGILPPALAQTSVIVDLAVHDIDVVSYLLGRDPVVVGAMAGRAWDGAHEDWADLLLAYGDAACSIQVNWVTPIKVRTLAVTGTSGYAELNYLTQTLALYEATPSLEALDFADFVRRYGTPARREIAVEGEEPLRLELASFVESVRAGVPFDVPGEVGLAAVRVAHAAWRIATGPVRVS